MTRHRKSAVLMRKLNGALAEGATVTIAWIQTVVVVARKQWRVTSLSRFQKHLEILLKNRGLKYYDDIARILKNCWFATAVA